VIPSRKTVIEEERKSVAGLDPNTAALLTYLLGWVTGLLFLVLEKGNNYVRFHAMQSVIFFGVITLAAVVLWLLLMVPYINILFMVLLSLLGLFSFAAWAILMLKAYQGDRFMLPWVGERAEGRTSGARADSLP
jgi:uncharacterized membrane protein